MGSNQKQYKVMGLILFTLCLVAGAAQGWAGPVELAGLDLGRMSAGWGKARANKSVQGNPLSIGGRRFERGVGTHADSELWLALDGSADSFSAQVGVDDEVGHGPASVEFVVLGDGGRELWRSGLCKAGEPARACQVKLQGVRQLGLVVVNCGDGIDCDHADWAEAVLLTQGQRPEALKLPRETAVILTPAAPPTPRINGARIFGVRPGKPFLFTIPATGERPMQFYAKGLPKGLVVDKNTGRITGRVARRGQYHVTLEARNRLGRDRRDFRIIVGDTLALTPPMGWNTWYSLFNSLTDQKVRAEADAMVSSGLIDHGFAYINLDDCWATRPGSPAPEISGPQRDSEGMIQPSRNFPDMKALCDYIHAKGLKAGIYSSPGPLTCAEFVGSYRYEAADARQYAAWGFDFLKYDWCSYGTVIDAYNLEEMKKPYQLMWGELQKLDRDLVFNLCQYGQGNVWEWGAQVGNSWRTTGDLSVPGASVYQSFTAIGFGQNGLEKYAGPGHWNDPDYLLLGQVGDWQGGSEPVALTPNEEYTYVSLWCLLTAPLFLGSELTKLDPFTLNLLTNDEVLAVDQDPLGRQAARVGRSGDGDVWAKPLEDGSRAVGLFNRGLLPAKVKVRWAELGLKGSQHVRDLWRQKDLGNFSDGYETVVPRHGVVLIRVAPAGK